MNIQNERAKNAANYSNLERFRRILLQFAKVEIVCVHLGGGQVNPSFLRLLQHFLDRRFLFLTYRFRRFACLAWSCGEHAPSARYRFIPSTYNESYHTIKLKNNSAFNHIYKKIITAAKHEANIKN